MILTLIFGIVLLILHKRKLLFNNDIIFLIIGFSLIIMHSLLILFVNNNDFGVLSGDAQYYYKSATYLKNNFFSGNFELLLSADVRQRYWGFILFNLLSFVCDNAVVNTIFIRLNILLFLCIVLIRLKSFLFKVIEPRNKTLMIYLLVLIQVIFVWYSLFNLRDGIVSGLALLYFIFLFEKKYFQLLFVSIIMLFFKDILIYSLILGTLFVLSLLKLNQDKYLLKLVAMFTIGFYTIWAIVPLPSSLNFIFKKIVKINKSDERTQNIESKEIETYFDKNQQLVGEYIAKRYIMHLPYITFPSNPLKKIVNPIFNAKYGVASTPISTILFILASAIAYFVIPIIIVILLFYEHEFSYLKEIKIWLALSMFLFFFIPGIYIIKFGYIQLRHANTIFPLLLVGIMFVNINKRIISVSKILFAVLVLLCLVQFVLKPL